MVDRASIVGSGPNGITAAIILRRAGIATTVFEAEPVLGGGARSAELTLPGFIHDLCSAAHPMAVSSPAFAQFPLADFGLEWIHSPAAVAHPLDDGTAITLERSVADTASQLGRDAGAYRFLIGGLAEKWPRWSAEIMAPIGIPKSISVARFGSMALLPATSAKILFRDERARALFAGLAAHSVLPLESMASSAIGWALGIAGHSVGWPIPRGGSQAISNALAGYFRSLGGEIVCGRRIRSLDEVQGLAMLDVTPRQFMEIAHSTKMKNFRYGPGVFKMDWALNAPIPWTARECSRAATVHLGGTFDEIAQSERLVWEGKHPERPFVLLTQPSLFDDSRAPAGKHTAWAYCHVPNGSTVDMSNRIEAQIERFAPGFCDTIAMRVSANTVVMERHNANLVGGDITGGASTLGQLIFRPTRKLYRTGLRGVYLCSSSTPPGGGVHGMCGYHAAMRALREVEVRGR